jgi:hypothetical protein
MATEVLRKKRIARVCGDCGEEIAKGVEACETDDCETTTIKKSLVIVTKATGDEDDDDLDLENAAVEDLTDEDDADDDDDSDDDSDDDADDDSDDDDEDDEEVTPEPLTEVGKRVMAVEALNLSTSLAEKIQKIFGGAKISKAPAAYEKAMEEFNGVMDAAADTWLTGASVSKTSESKAQVALITKRVHKIMKGVAMPTKKRPDGLKIDELPDEVKAYISSLEGGDDDANDVEKIYKGLSPEAAKIVKDSAALIEKNTASKFMDIAKKFTQLPGERDELAKSLRKLAETDTAAYDTMINTLTAANENLEQAGIFKSYGRPGTDETETDISKKAKEAVAKGDYDTIEQAEVALMDGSAYRPTA